MARVDIGIVGLGVMGPNLALNMEDKGFTVIGYDHATKNVDSFLAGKAKGTNICGVYSLAEMAEFVSRPRKVMLMVPPGRPVDDVIQTLAPLLEEGDVIIDGGNSHYKDTDRRAEMLAREGIHLIGAGISGGAEGALKGPSIMPGGSRAAWPQVRPIFEKIAAKLDDGTPAIKWVGPDGSGHFVKMVHNGIEYAAMQLISEAYFVMKEALGLTPEEMRTVFADWNRGELNSYLMGITVDILSRRDKLTGSPLVDVILDAAEQKGTGTWASQTALELGVPVPTITEAVFARSISALKSERVAASKVLRGPGERLQGDRDQLIEVLRRALYASMVCSYAQGFALMRQASTDYDWNLNLADIALIWRAGCIVRAGVLESIEGAYRSDPGLPNLLVAPHFAEALAHIQDDWRSAVTTAENLGIPVPAFASTLAYYDSYRTERLPANLIQAQRDYFGSHKYRRVDRDGTFHTEWMEQA